MKKTEITSISLMTFALFLGAGNLIFPPLMAQQAGENWIIAIIGFLITAVGIPTFAIIVLGRLPSMSALSEKLPNWMDKTFWIVTMATLGPVFGMPRAITVAYEMGIKPFTSENYLLPFTIVFCVVCLMCAVRPNKLVDYIGKVMTPIMIIMLSALVLAAIFNPLGVSSEAVAPYIDKAGTNGLIQGYMTLDGVASVAFGWVIINAIRNKGITSQSDVRKYSKIIALSYGFLMSICYLSIGYLGSTSSLIAAGATNGGEILSLYSYAEFGNFGKVILAILVVLTCLSTVIGLTSSNAQFYKTTFNVPSRLTSIIVVLVTAIISNFGLDTIIKVSLPAILIICPIAVSLIAACAFIPKAKTHSKVVIISAIFGMIDTLNILGYIKSDSVLSILPLYETHMSWLLPVAFAIAIVKYKYRRTTIYAN